MSRRSIWAIESVVTLLVALGLIYAANFRYARPLVDPAPPTPDYALQASIAYFGIAGVAIVAALLTAALARRPTPHPSSAAGVAATIVASGIVVIVIAFTVAAP
jgi:hypothetical protein